MATFISSINVVSLIGSLKAVNCDVKSYMKNGESRLAGVVAQVVKHWLMDEKDPVQIPLRSESIWSNAHLFSQSLTPKKMIGWWSHKMISPAH